MTEIFRGKFPWVNTRKHVKRVTGSAHEMVRVVSWNGVSMPMVQEPGLTSLHSIPKMRNFSLMSAVVMKVLLVLKVVALKCMTFLLCKLHMYVNSLINTGNLTMEYKPLALRGHVANASLK